jgi:nucleotide-binding universal stress UspA family protein
MTMKILLAVDGSACALDAVRHALQLVAQGLRASFVLVNVQEPASLYELAVAHDAEQLKALRAAAGADLLAPAEALLDAAGAEYESEVAGGSDVANLIVELAENYGCDAIFVGARGVGDADAGGAGPVAEALVAHAPMPVTVVRPAEGAGEGTTAADADASDDADR